MREKGQIILILILVLTVALAIGIAVIQRSLSDISTSTKVEQSGRAFSAAEAGIEKAISAQSSIGSVTLGNNATIQGVDKVDIPQGSNALEYPPISKEEIAQVWLADPNTLTAVYTTPRFNVYFGIPNLTTDKPALEVTVVSLSGGNYVVTKEFFDADSTRVSTNGFTAATCNNPSVLTNANTTNSTFYCRVSVSGYAGTPILARMRILYSSASQPVALAPVFLLGGGTSSLPSQARIYTSTGVAGNTQRKIQVFRLDKVVPFYFDYAIFSAGDINK